MKKPVPFALALMIGAAHVPASAQFKLPDFLSVSGFGTLGYVQTNSDQGEFRREQQAQGATKSGSLRVDSNLGLQLTATATPWLSATVQTLTTQRTQDDINTRIEWAYVKATPMEGVAVRAGRMSLPNFMISDSRRVGYANNALRPPNEVYGLDLLNGGLKGLEASWRLPIASGSFTTTVLGGTSVYRDVGSPATPVDKLRGVNVLWDGDWYQLRAGRIQAKPDLANLAAILTPLLPAGKQLSDETYTFTGLGFSAERANIVAQGEYVMRRSSLFKTTVDIDGWYLMGGYRMGNLLPYVQYGKAKPKNSASTFSLPQHTVSAGLRWDVWSSAALKLQVERVDTDGTPGTFLTPSDMTAFGPVARPVTKPVTALSVALDFVF